MNRLQTQSGCFLCNDSTFVVSIKFDDQMNRPYSKNKKTLSNHSDSCTLAIPSRSQDPFNTRIPYTLHHKLFRKLSALNAKKGTDPDGLGSMTVWKTYRHHWESRYVPSHRQHGRFSFMLENKYVVPIH